jgi:hypothetical protein
VYKITQCKPRSPRRSLEVLTVCILPPFPVTPDSHLHATSFRLLLTTRVRIIIIVPILSIKHPKYVIITIQRIGTITNTTRVPYDSMELTVFTLTALTATACVVQAAPATHNEDPCWKVCLESLPRCPGGMYSNNKETRANPCWTCCRTPDYDPGKEVTFVMQTDTCRY